MLQLSLSESFFPTTIRRFAVSFRYVDCSHSPWRRDTSIGRRRIRQQCLCRFSHLEQSGWLNNKNKEIKGSQRRIKGTRHDRARLSGAAKIAKF